MDYRSCSIWWNKHAYICTTVVLFGSMQESKLVILLILKANEQISEKKCKQAESSIRRLLMVNGDGNLITAIDSFHSNLIINENYLNFLKPFTDFAETTCTCSKEEFFS